MRVIVSGMHRSGTSLMSKMLSLADFHPGKHLLSTSSEEYFEDSIFVDLHRRWLSERVPLNLDLEQSESHPDWGILWGSVEELSSSIPHPDSSRSLEIEGYVRDRDQMASNWMAKDPRSSLFLDHWAVIDELKFVILYRNPWDVIDSAMRLGHPLFCRRPRVVHNAWLGYNKSILDFMRHNPNRALLVPSEKLISDGDAVWTCLQKFLEVDLGEAPAVRESDRFVERGSNDALSSLYRLLYPGTMSVLAELDSLACIPRAHTPTTEVAGRVLRGGELPEGTGVQVVIPCRDDGDFLAESIASVEFEISDQVELTIVNDGSTDPETLRILDELRSSGRQVIDTEPIGLSGSRNLGISSSKSLGVIPLDSDNRLKPSLVKAVGMLVESRVDIVHGQWREFGMRDRVVEPPQLELASLLPFNTIDACALFSRRILQEIQGWDENLPFWEDWDAWLTCVSIGARSHRIDDVTFDYLVRPNSLSSRISSSPSESAPALKYIQGKHESSFDATTARLFREWLQLHEDATELRIELSNCLRQQVLLESRVRQLEQQISELRTSTAWLAKLRSVCLWTLRRFSLKFPRAKRHLKTALQRVRKFTPPTVRFSGKNCSRSG